MWIYTAVLEMASVASFFHVHEEIPYLPLGPSKLQNASLVASSWRLSIARVTPLQEDVVSISVTGRVFASCTRTQVSSQHASIFQRIPGHTIESVQGLGLLVGNGSILANTPLKLLEPEDRVRRPGVRSTVWNLRDSETIDASLHRSRVIFSKVEIQSFVVPSAVEVG